MKTQYTDQARTAIMYAEKMARKCGHSYIGTEHLLAGLIHEEQGTAGMVLRDLGIIEARLKDPSKRNKFSYDLAMFRRNIEILKSLTKFKQHY